MSGLEVLAILTAVKDGAELLGSFMNLVDRYVHLPEQLLRIEFRFTALKGSLEIWKEDWGVEERHANSYYTTLWGVNGWKEIRACLGLISKSATKIRTSIREMIRSTAVVSRNSPQIRFYESQYEAKYDEAIVAECLKQISKSWTRFFRFRKALFNECGRLDGLLDNFDTDFRSLQKMSKHALYKNHREELRGKSRRLGNREFVRLIMSKSPEYQHTRSNADLLYRAFIASRSLSCSIELNKPTVSHTPTRSSPRRSPSPVPQPEKDFQLLLTNANTISQVLVHPVRFTEQPRDGDFAEDLADAMSRMTPLNPQCYLLTANTSHEYAFTLHEALDAELRYLSYRRALKGDLRTHSLRDKVAISKSLAEGFYRLLGSQWLNHMDAENVHVMLGSSSWTSILHAKDTNRMLLNNTAYQRMANGFRRGGSIAQQTQIYRLGILFTELALGAQISSVAYDRDSDTIKLKIGAISDEELDATAVATRVDFKMGNVEYGDVVHFCLSALQSNRLLNARDMDEPFATHVLEPLKRIAR